MKRSHFISMACLMMLLVISIIYFKEGMFSRDGVVFMELAQLVDSGQSDLAIKHPQHPLTYHLISLFEKGTGSYVLAGRFVSIIGILLVLVGAYFLSREFWGRQAALFSVFVVGLQPFLWNYGTDILSDPLYWGCLLCGVSLMVIALSSKKLSLAALSGLFYSLAYLTRPEGFVFFLLTGCLLLCLVLVKKVEIRTLLTFCFVFSVVSLPYVKSLHTANGGWRLSGKVNFLEMMGLGSVVNVGSSGTEVLQIEGLQTDNARDLWDSLPSSAEKIKYFISEQCGGLIETTGFLHLIVFICLFKTSRFKRRELFILLTFIAIQMLMIQKQWFDDHYLSRRHWMPIGIALGILSSRAISCLFDRRGFKVTMALFSVLYLFSFCFQTKIYKSFDKRKKAHKVAYKDLGSSLLNFDHKYLVGADVRTAWFAKKKYIQWPYYEDPLEFAEKVNEKFQRQWILLIPKKRTHQKFGFDSLVKKFETKGFVLAAESDLEYAMIQEKRRLK